MEAQTLWFLFGAIVVVLIWSRYDNAKHDRDGVRAKKRREQEARDAAIQNTKAVNARRRFR
jgi:hypothetical protein